MPLQMWVLEHSGKGGRRERRLDVTTVDISVGGMAFYYRQYIHPGSTIRARFDALPGKPYVTAVVRNCTLIGPGRHRIGMEFIEVRRDEGDPPIPDRGIL
ncbi:MAG: PilZ domain-containing protein [Phycisphaerae bacterium]